MDALGTETEMFYLMALGQRLKMARQARGLSQLEIANRVAVSRAAVSQWEAGQVEARLSKLRAAAIHLDISLGWLVDGHGAPFAFAAPIKAAPRKRPR